MITIDKETFERVVSAAASSDIQVFEAMTDALTISNDKVQVTVLSHKLDFDTLPDRLRQDIIRYICLDAFYTAIPQLDLVLTPTGFGIVNNQNVSPASHDRVESLRTLVQNGAYNALDRVITGLLGNEVWMMTANARMLVNSLFITSDQLRDYAGKKEASRSDLFGLRPLISEAEELIFREISSEYLVHLIKGIREAGLSDDEILLVHELRQAVGFYINKQLAAFRLKLADVVNVLDADADKYPVYAGSIAYKVKHFEHYRNEKDDTCYFWG